MKTLIITPLQEEFDFLLHGCIRRGFQPEEAVVGKLPVVQLPELAITLALGGLGKAQFAVQSQHLLDVDPDWDLVICTGAGGALVDHLSVGDVVVATETVEHDIYNNFGSPIVPRFDSASTALASFKQAAQAIDTFKVHFAPVASGDEDVVDSERRNTIRQLTGAYVVAWEGAGGARACKFSGVPFIEIRGVTDGADGNAAASFETNLAHLMDNIAALLIAWANQVRNR